MSRDTTIEVILGLITLIHERNGCKVSRSNNQWLCRFEDLSQSFDVQLEAAPHGCGLVIPAKGGLL